ncbi:MAG TPA: hypothetical protein VGP82_04490 [Ktedonobacterales bacterium]|nr:hypothetical protein [Ktedonobacterales bacterium]
MTQQKTNVAEAGTSKRRTRRRSVDAVRQEQPQTNRVDQVDRSGNDREDAMWKHVLDLASDALLEGLTHERVIEALAERLHRDTHYLAYRRACRRRTAYDGQVAADMRALALAACWLRDTKPPSGVASRKVK